MDVDLSGLLNFQSVISALIGALISGLGLYFAHRTQQRAAHTEEVSAKGEHELGLTDRWERFASEQKEARQETEAEVRVLRGEVAAARQEARAAHEEVDRLRARFRRLEGRLVMAVDFIRRLMAWATTAESGFPMPTPPDEIAAMLAAEDDDEPGDPGI